MRRIRNSTYMGVILCLLGVGIYLLPEWQTARLMAQTEQELERFSEIIREVPTAENAPDPVREAVTAYNEFLYANDQPGFDADGLTEGPPVAGLSDRLFGSIRIPEMDVTLPLYLGATDRNMADGAAVLGGTSLPIGGENTHCVIAGHRGYRGAPYFREIEILTVGDAVILTNPWEELTYRVEKIEIIGPMDSERLRICAGRDLVTLITCHPYRSHGKKRYAVTCVREEETSAAEPEENALMIISSEGTSRIRVEESSEGDLRREDAVRLLGARILILLLMAVLGTLLMRMEYGRKIKYEETTCAGTADGSSAGIHYPDGRGDAGVSLGTLRGDSDRGGDICGGATT